MKIDQVSKYLSFQYIPLFKCFKIRRQILLTEAAFFVQDPSIAVLECLRALHAFIRKDSPSSKSRVI